ncbi:hypothetical protein [Hasllibacter halocynthiae]|nr:hypothetical protein [Hasllibacter halocynthiae]
MRIPYPRILGALAGAAVLLLVLWLTSGLYLADDTVPEPVVLFDY